MNNKSSRYDIQITKDYEQLNLDFILPKCDEKAIHGTVWDDSDDPKKVPDALIMLFIPGPTYYDSDPNDLKSIGYVTADHNGEFAIGPFKIGSTIIIKIFNPIMNVSLLNEAPEEFEYINDESDKISYSDDNSEEVEDTTKISE
ncbi:hypothetical protein OW763_13675 [Clostridium aestuarii]|uniref:Uncharacterized protein n=1 Tax=Clostridium aestuarii TaxID=338193 RepID=A0ABT4D2A3_9CLOT|nr:hypothetical protein [Clostridium aestuarii]MCY6485381.1 hypothetical protein [Clostridium aestuarii]